MADTTYAYGTYGGEPPEFFEPVVALAERERDDWFDAVVAAGPPDEEPGACPVCGSRAVHVEGRYRVRPIGSFSLAGSQMKFSAHRVPVLVCDGCGVASDEEKW